MTTNETAASAVQALQDAGMESPAGVRMSLAAAMTLGFAPGSFYRGARLFCINLLLTYKSGCAGRCAYCGLSRTRGAEASEGGKSFIRVPWPVFSLEQVIAAIRERASRVKRVCISMVTNRRAVQDTAAICAQIRGAVDVPVSLLIAPTIVSKSDLLDFRAAGADKIGVAIDLATPELFDRYRGAGVGGPHVWNRYWDWEDGGHKYPAYILDKYNQMEAEEQCWESVQTEDADRFIEQFFSAGLTVSADDAAQTGERRVRLHPDPDERYADEFLYHLVDKIAKRRVALFVRSVFAKHLVSLRQPVERDIRAARVR